MTLPDFLVIGAARAGTTWLDAVLRTHPQVYLPTRRKEVHFFDQNADRGLAWYEEFFPDATEAAAYAAIGETTPRYLYEPEVPELIATTLPDVRLVAILRHPADRAHSHYGLAVRDRGASTSFESLAETNPHVVGMSHYGEQLQRYVDRFGRDRLHIIVMEEATRDPQTALAGLGAFLGVDPAGFEPDVEVANQSFTPRHPRTRAALKRLAKGLRRRGFDGVAEWGKGRAAGRALGGAAKVPALDPSTRSRLAEQFADDIATVERLLGRPVSVWADGR